MSDPYFLHSQLYVDIHEKDVKKKKKKSTYLQKMEKQKLSCTKEALRN